MLKILVMVSGGGTNLQAIINAIEEKIVTNTEIVAVISNKKDAYALTRAKKQGIPSVCICQKEYENRNDFQQALLEKVKEFDVDLIILAGFLVILSKELIKEYEGRIINIHPSLIPSFCGAGYYGLKVHEAVLKRGVKITGATVHYVDEGTDTGSILLQKAVNVEIDDTPEKLQNRVMEEAEWIILPKAIDAIANNRVKVSDGVATIIEMDEK